MQLCTITPTGLTDGEIELRLYEIESHTNLRPTREGGRPSTGCGEVAPQSATQRQSSRSSAVTRPFVISRILRICLAEGARSPLKYRLIDAHDTPSASAKAVCDMPSWERNSASVMGEHYHVGNAGQAPITMMVTDFSSAISYLIGMGTELDRLLKEQKRKKVSAAEIARRAGTHATRLTLWRKGTDVRNMPDVTAIALAKVLNCTPFDMNPDFMKIVLDGIKDEEKRERHRLSLELTFRYQNAVLPIEDERAAVPVDAPPVAPRHQEKRESRRGRTVKR